MKRKCIECNEQLELVFQGAIVSHYRCNNSDCSIDECSFNVKGRMKDFLRIYDMSDAIKMTSKEL